MVKVIERILQLDEIKKRNIIILKYAGKIERFSIQSIDNIAIRATAEIGGVSMRIFPATQLITDNWYVEREKKSDE